MIRTPIGRLRVVGWIEGVSFLLLLGVAMPLKYIVGMPEAVRVVGMAHGILWMAFIACVFDVRLAHGWSLGRCALAVLASILPFGPFVFDRTIRDEQQTSPAAV